MFARIKKSGKYQYLQIVHNERIDGHVRQRVIATLGRLDALQENGRLDGLLESLAKFTDHAAVINAVRNKQVQLEDNVHIGPPLVFQRLWEQLGIPDIIERLLAGRRFQFSIERVLFLTVLHRLFDPGSDRAAERWCRRYELGDLKHLDLQHFYRTMGWLGEPLPLDQQPDNKQPDGMQPDGMQPDGMQPDGKQLDGKPPKPPLGPRLHTHLIEEALFARRRDLFSGLRLFFIDTTSIYFEGGGGESLGKRGHSKDHRPDLNQIVLAVVLDDTGRPVCCEMLPGNTADITTLLPLADRLRDRFGITDICVVADRGMISAKVIEQLTARGMHYILGARLRNVKEIREDVLSRGGRYREVQGARVTSKDPSPLKVKQVMIEDRRYIVCHNEEQARKDRADREAILEKLREEVQNSGKKLIGNKGFRKYLSTPTAGSFQIDEAKVKSEARFDGKWVLRTDTDLSSEDVALRYKDLLQVEDTFRRTKTLLETRPIFHKRDDTIRGHIFCSFLSLVLLKELQDRLADRGWKVEWKHLRDDLDELQEHTLTLGDKRFRVRSAPVGEAGKALQAVGVALGPSVRILK